MDANTAQEQSGLFRELSIQAEQLIKEKKRSPEKIKHLLGELRMFKEFKSLVYRVRIDYRKSLSDMIAEGQYATVNERIDKFFNNAPPKEDDVPLKGTIVHEVDLVLVQVDFEKLGKGLYEHNLIFKHLEEMNLKPAKIEHLLAFGAKYKKIQKKFFRIYAVGSCCQFGFKNLWFPFLAVEKDKRVLDTENHMYGNWHNEFHFLAIYNENA